VPRVVRPFPRPASALAAALVTVGAMAPASDARAQPQQEEDGGGGAARQGPPRELASPPDDSDRWARACSALLPLCVLVRPGGQSGAAAEALAAAERAWNAVVGVLGLPAPDPDVDGSWHAYLVDQRVEAGARALPAALDPVAHYDRASSFAIVDAETAPGCALDFAMARAVAWGALLRAVPATDEGSARAEVEAIARLAVPCAGDDDDAWVFQASPERTVVDASSPSFSRGAAFFFDWLDASLARRPAALIQGVWALAPTRTPAGAARWSGGPTGFDVLRVSLKDALWPGSTFDDALVRFAVARAIHDPPARLAWHVPWPDHARRFASPEPPAPTGASYVAIDHAGAPPGARLHVEATWEDYGKMRWELAKVDAAGRITGEWPVISPDKATSAALTVEDLDGADRILVVGVDIGSTEHAFDPDQAWWEPHGWLLTIEAR
jgi:hypothetical protein